MDSKHLKTILKYEEELSKKYPDLAEAISILIEKNKDSELLRRMLKHELDNPLIAIDWCSNRLIIKQNLSDSTKTDYYKIINSSSKIIKNLSELVTLDDCSKEELKENSKEIIPEEIAENYSISYDALMKKEKIGLRLKYDKFPDHTPIKIYFDPSVFITLWGTLFGNSIAWAQPETKIRQGIKINKNNLELSMENNYIPEKRRNNIGMGKGNGLYFTKRIMETLGGKLINYSSPQITSEYHTQKKMGANISDYDEKKFSLFGVKLLIPMDELKKDI